jgi:phosphoglycerate kinase
MLNNFKKLSDHIGSLKGKKVLVRLDLNVPVINNEVRDPFRINQSLPTISVLREAGARIIILSHIENADTSSLSGVAKFISGYYPVRLVEGMDELRSAAHDMKDGDIVMFENLRLFDGEKANSSVFATELAAVADAYVNDAFSVCHREHASVVLLPKLLPAYAGTLLCEEIEKLSCAFNPPHPFVFVLGGAKFDTKLPLMLKFLDLADTVFVGGALANDLLKEKGYEVGSSLVSKSRVNLSPIISSLKVITPVDVVATNSYGNDIRRIESVDVADRIVDIGPETVAQFANAIAGAKFVLWNGPMGDYEHGFSSGTEGIAQAIIESGAYSVMGGADSVAVVRNAGLLDKFTFVSTGGGAMLDFLANGTLPGIEALKQ